MKPNALFMGWNRAVVGRESHAMELFQKVQAWYAKLQAEGTIESHETMLIGAHGGDMNGFTVLRGDADKLAALRHSDEMVEVILEAGHSLEGFGVLEAYHSAALMGLMGKWGAMVAKG